MKKLLLSLALATVVATPSLALASKARTPVQAGVAATHGVVQPWGAVATDPDRGIRFELNREAQEGIS